MRRQRIRQMQVVFGEWVLQQSTVEMEYADAAAMTDLLPREWLMLAPIAAVVLWMGIYPESFLAPMRGDIRAIEARLAETKPAGDAMFKLGAPAPAGEAKAEGAH